MQMFGELHEGGATVCLATHDARWVPRRSATSTCSTAGWWIGCPSRHSPPSEFRRAGNPSGARYNRDTRPRRPTMPLAAGSRLGPYEIVGRLGAGGMGVVYRARDPRLGRDVAVKVLPDDVAADPERLRRFEREARAAGALDHPNVVTVHDLGNAAGTPFVVTELLEGETLRERLRSGALAPRKAVELAVQVARGLAAAHERGIVHRDLKPENLFLTRDGRVKILDFGLATRRLPGAPGSAAQTLSRETSQGAIVGTLGYLSPEQARGQEADARSDIFALGAVLYEMLAGLPAFSRPSAAEALSAILREDPPALPPGTPGWLERIARRCLEKAPAERFAAARDLAFALEASGAEPTDPTPAGAPATRSVAVLPFKDLARSRDDAHLGIGLADATITELALVGALMVRPTAAILRYQERATDPQQAARELGVDAVVDGSFQRAGERLRVTVQLVSAEGRSLWATKVDASLADVFRMQDEVSRRIAQALHVELSSGDERRLAQAARNAPTGPAYEPYLRGRMSLFRGRLAGVNAAIDAFEQARDADPGFAPAWAALGDAYARMAFEHAPEGAWYERAQAACARALELDPALAEGRYLRGRLAWSPHARFDHATALAEAAGALAAHPALLAARYLLGLVLFHVGLVEESEAEFGQALASDPGDQYARMHVASCRLHLGRFAEVVSLAQDGLRDFPDRWWWSNLVLGLLRLGRLEEAARSIDRLRRENPDYPQALSLGAVLAALQGDAARARRGIERTEQSPRELGHYHHAQYDVACALAALGDEEPAMAWLRAAAGNGYPCPTFFAVDPLLDPLRGRADFSALMQELEAERGRYRRLYLDLSGRLAARPEVRGP
jgi:serine/threonine protein kinase/Flp pilus assembly protein TadD